MLAKSFLSNIIFCSVSCLLLVLTACGEITASSDKTPISVAQPASIPATPATKQANKVTKADWKARWLQVEKVPKSLM